MSKPTTGIPVDPARHRAFIAAIYASLPEHMQADALALVTQWPRIIHNLARAGELTAPEFARDRQDGNSEPSAQSQRL